MAWTEIQTVRNITGVSEEDYTDEVIQDFISLAQKEVNSKINSKVIREKIIYLDKTRENKIDGSNTRYYVKNWKGNYFGDTDYDGDVGIDDIKIYQVDSNGIETVLTPSAISVTNMYFDLSSAPSNVELFIDYTYLSYDPVNPDAFLSQVVAYLTASYMVSGEESGSIRLGSLALGESKETLFTRFTNKYESLMNQLQENSTGGAIWGLQAVNI